jgi:hypothetical protein
MVFFLLCIREKITLIYYAKQNTNNVLEEKFVTLQFNVIEDFKVFRILELHSILINQAGQE